MFSFLKKRWAGLAALALFITVSTVQSFSATTSGNVADCSCNAPASASITSMTSNSFSVAWVPASGADEYESWYVRVGDGYTSPHTTQKGTSFNCTGLAPGQYIFYVKTICGHSTSDIIVLEDIIIG